MQPRDEVAAHAEDHDRDGQDDADPEAAGHVAQFLGRAGVRGDDDGLEGHPADGAGAGAVLADLGVHRAGVLDRLALTRGRLPMFWLSCMLGAATCGTVREAMAGVLAGVGEELALAAG